MGGQGPSLGHDEFEMSTRTFKWRCPIGSRVYESNVWKRGLGWK